MDLFWIYELVTQFPDLSSIVDAKLPQGTSAEDDGMGGGGAGDGNCAVSRADAKRAGEAARSEARAARKKSSADKRAADFQKATEAGMANALKGLTPLLEKLAPKPSAARSRAEEAESKSARLALSADLRASYESCKKSLAAESAKGGASDDFYIGCLQRELAKIKRCMTKDADEAL